MFKEWINSLKNNIVAKRPRYRTWFSPVIIFIATCVYFLPIIIRIGGYIPGGDAMFNAWVMARNQHCILRQHCPDYTTANIYYPNKQTMLYSEVEISPSVVTLPLHLVNDNPVLAYNLITIVSFFLAGASMYLLARYFSKGNEFFAVTIGLFFEFSPIMLAATHNLQSLSIFCLPLAVLWIMKYIDMTRKRYLYYLFFTLLYVFYASWYQMIFVLITVGAIITGMAVFKIANFKRLAIISVVIVGAVLATTPLAVQYLRFSKENKTIYPLSEKVANSATVADYVIPPAQSLLGQLYIHNKPYNAPLPTTSSYAGISTYLALFLVIVYLLRKKEMSVRTLKLGAIYGLIALLGFIGSIGPLVKLTGSPIYKAFGYKLVIPGPFLLVHRYIQPLGFLRGLGRFSVLFTFVVCCVAAVLSVRLGKNRFYIRHKLLLSALIVLVVFVDAMPARLYSPESNKHAYFSGVPAVYKYIKDHPKIDNIIVLQAEDYPGVTFWFARTEVVLWSGYHNRNIFNGYSGYTPTTYDSDNARFINMEESGPKQMKDMGIDYVIVDSELYTNKPEVLARIPDIIKSKPVYQDKRYSMYKLDP